ncbi:Rha family transcriptional regulator [Enterococcus faecalis]|uniref:Rha family transcriptional regulator n=1 Tax=Enterococcus faecalis TaxID=1351 RepID=UPI0012E26F13|nr:Rha family transcriptional regulator [Enterococcus faecalis]MDU6566488.1 Rha family transcriptional regulator [Enterococcus faecalis]MUN46105.1 phage regulatory protein [Enterococcus faecalis]HCY8956417.1 Rha family transcriptional regulator [Enterococcus faecalis]
MTNLVIMKDQQAVTSSLQVAEVFEKQHKHVLEAIDELKQGVAENSADLFYEDTYIHPQNKQSYRQVIMNRDGFTLLAMGFTGQKALQFKLKYIEAFNQMENHIKEQLDTSTLSPELQFMNSVVQSLAKQEIANKRLENKVDNITDIIALNTTDWRKECRSLVNKMAKTQGEYGAYQEIQTAIYNEVDRRAGSSLKTRLTNLKNRMAGEGVSKSKRDKTNKLDVIDSDKRLKEIYLAVVKDFAIKYGIWKEK